MIQTILSHNFACKFFSGGTFVFKLPIKRMMAYKCTTIAPTSILNEELNGKSTNLVLEL